MKKQMYYFEELSAKLEITSNIKTYYDKERNAWRGLFKKEEKEYIADLAFYPDDISEKDMIYHIQNFLSKKRCEDA